MRGQTFSLIVPAHVFTHKTSKMAIRAPPREWLGLSGTLRAADRIDYVALWIVAMWLSARSSSSSRVTISKLLLALAQFA